MSVDELIRAATIDREIGAAVLDEEESEAIIAALRAGKAMRDAWAIHYPVETRPMRIAVQAWEDATESVIVR